jgi:hypothetical protein
MAVATSAEKEGGKKAKISNNFGRRNPLQAAKLNGGGSKPEIAGETPHKKVHGGEASFLFRLNCERAHASTKGVPSAGVKAVDDDDLYNNNAASAGQLDDRGCKPKITGGGALKKAQSREASSLFRLDRMRAHRSTKGGGCAGSTPLMRTTRTTTKMKTMQATGVERRGGAHMTWPIKLAMGAQRQGPSRHPPGVGAAPPSEPGPTTSQAAACSSA